MRRLFSFALFTCSTTLLACSGEGFDLADPAPDAGDTGNDTGALVEETGHDSGADTELTDTSEAADSGDASDPSDSGDSSDSTDAAPADTCTPNACGGCKSLSGEVGASCGACGDGKLACDGADAVKCEGARALNACGGCSALPNSPGMSCGACGDGKWACDGTDAVKCGGARALNACGGCATLANAPGAACGICGGGKFVCDGVDATKCSDPVTTPAPGTTCGTCGTSTYVCAPDGKSTACSKPDDRNACGGCGTLVDVPGTSCGSCGAWTCTTDKSSLTCKEATPSTGSSCGTCMRSKFVCSAPGKTTCEQPDDRQSIAWGPTDTTVDKEDVVSPRQAHGLEVYVGKTGEITKLQLAIKRAPYDCPLVEKLPHPDSACSSCGFSLWEGAYRCTVPSPVVGKLTATVWIGYPGALGAKAVASHAADATILAAGGTAWVEFELTTSLNVTAGQKLYVELASDSTAYQFTWNRTPYSTTKYEKIYYRVPSSETTWGGTSNVSRPAKFFSNTCDY